MQDLHQLKTEVGIDPLERFFAKTNALDLRAAIERLPLDFGVPQEC